MGYLGAIRFGGIVIPFLISLGATVSHASSIIGLQEITKGELRKPVYLRVRIAQFPDKVVISGNQLEILEGRKDQWKLVHKSKKLSEWAFHCRPGQVEVLPLLSSKASHPKVLGRFITVRAPDEALLSFNGKPYREELRVISVDGHCEVVNLLPVEDYLAGLVNAEFSSKWSEEAIAAQVVAARTYAYFQALQSREKVGSYYDVDSTTKDQVYDGFIREDENATRMVDRTEGLVLTNGLSEQPVPIKAFYHSTCGGMTEIPKHVWGRAYPGLSRTVKCPYCVSSPRFQWDLKLSQDDIITALIDGLTKDQKRIRDASSYLPVFKERRLLGIMLGPKKINQRLTQVITLWQSKKGFVRLPIRAIHFREWLGNSRIRSTSFEVKPVHENPKRYWVFSGRGNGHGVGMCQWGAKVMGEKGFTMGQILGFYYPDAIIRKLW